MRSRNPNPAAIEAIAKIILPKQGKNNEHIKFLKSRGLQYLAQHRSQFNDRLNIYAEEYINIHK